MRRVLVLVTLSLALASSGCPGETRNEAAGADGPEADPDLGGAGEAPPDASCFVDADCEPVASSCCECPTFALPVSDGVGAVCEDVGCDEVLECPAQQAICDSSGTCALACAEVSCDLSCANGFQLDAAGCSICACNAEPEAAECADDGDCTQVAADCCGCSRGGLDTAVPAADAGGFVDALDCDGSEVCPEVDVCSVTELPTCTYGR
ncbi:MAG: hypothetical protein KJO07_05455, partial [Deltaproteobacteria bacterium]|nr:hypothetical protein [Deltaproteobacteria bacterium]